MKSIKFGELLHYYMDIYQDESDIDQELLEQLADWDIHYEKIKSENMNGKPYYNVIFEPSEE